MKFDISIIIVSYNVSEYIISCIESIYKHSSKNINFEIIVIDNNSIDDSVAQIKKLFPKVKLIENDYNCGFPKAVNKGVFESTGNKILILNPDTLFIDNSLEKFSVSVNNNEKVGAVGALLLDENGFVQQSCWEYPTLVNTILSIFFLDFFNIKKNYKIKNFLKPTEVSTISGAVFFIKRKLFLETGGFNEDLFWMEDIDLCVRLRKEGYINYILPANKIIHYSGKSSKKDYKTSILNQNLSKIKYFKIHSTALSVKILFLAILINIFIKILILFFLIPFSSIYRAKINAYIQTFLKLVRFRLS